MAIQLILDGNNCKYIHMDKKYYTSERSQQIVISLLKAHGIKKVIASPGTTNITFVGSIQNDPWFEIYSSVDERSAAYLACGLAAESGEPVVLSCTGATASRNYMPGLTEAFYRKLPVIAITATQGNHKIGHNIAQVIDRRNVPNDIVKLSVDIPVTRTADDEWYCTIQVNNAILETKRHGGGPVHINLATTYSRDFTVKEIPPVRVINRILNNDLFPELLKGRIAVFIASHKSWTAEETQALDAFCAANNAVVFCDHTSGYYGKYRVQFALVAGQLQYHSDLLSVDLLIHVGEVSGDYYSLNVKAKQTWRVSEDGKIRDTFKNLRYVFEMCEIDFFKYYNKKDDIQHIEYLNDCRNEYQKVIEKIPELPFSNVWIAQKVSGLLPKNSVLHLGILNTLRSWNFFEIPVSVRAFCNVGGFGIDGGLSTLVGASFSNPNKLYFGILGDLAFFYDMNVLGNHHLRNNVRIMLINNGRGTEFTNFDHLGYTFGKDADRYIAAAGHYGNKSASLVKHYVEDLGFEYLSASDKVGFEKCIKHFFASEISQKPIFFEVFTDSVDESNAEKMIRSAVYTEKDLVLSKLKSGIKSVVGENNVQKIKHLMK